MNTNTVSGAGPRPGADLRQDIGAWTKVLLARCPFLDEQSVRSMLQVEADAQEGLARSQLRHRAPRRGSYALAQLVREAEHQAGLNISNWIEQARHYGARGAPAPNGGDASSYDRLALLVASHRQSYAWAYLVGLQVARDQRLAETVVGELNLEALRKRVAAFAHSPGGMWCARAHVDGKPSLGLGDTVRVLGALATVGLVRVEVEGHELTKLVVEYQADGLLAEVDAGDVEEVARGTQ